MIKLADIELIAIANARAGQCVVEVKLEDEDMMAKIPPGTKFEEIDCGPPVGREIL